MVDRWRSSSSAPRRKPSAAATWCCSFSNPPPSPDLRSPPPPHPLSKPPKHPNPNPNFSPSPSPNPKLGFRNRILSPGRVSPIDSDTPPQPPPQIGDVAPDLPLDRVEEAPVNDAEGGDLKKVRLKGKDGRVVVVEVDGRVLGTDFGEIELGDVEDVEGVFGEVMEMMVWEGDFVGRLMKGGVSRSIDLLEMSFKIMFDRGVKSCLNYIEAVPWSESEEEKLKKLFTRCTFDEAVTEDILSRLLQSDGPICSENLAVQLIQSIVDGSNNNARKELQSLVCDLLSKSSVYQKQPIEPSKESLYSICCSCLNSLVVLFQEAADSTTPPKESKPLVERISKQVENLNWLFEILVDNQMAEEFVCLWAEQKELISLHKVASPMVRYELSRISTSVFMALGKGKLHCQGDVRFSVLDAWFNVLLIDFGWLKRCSKGLSIMNLEEGLGQALLTLPLKLQQRFFVEWFQCFSGKGTECPNLSRGFQVWWRRSFVRTTAGLS